MKARSIKAVTILRHLLRRLADGGITTTARRQLPSSFVEDSFAAGVVGDRIVPVNLNDEFDEEFSELQSSTAKSNFNS